MAALLGSDLAFVEKLVNGAGATNDVLSEDNLMQGRAMLSTVKEKLLNCSSDSVEHAELTELFAKLSVAVAPHKKTPPEVLQIIFRFLLCDDSNECRIKLPPTPENLRQAPLVLGQVCRKWRRISRSMRDLWSAEDIWIPASDDPKSSLDPLECASQILPYRAQLQLNYGALEYYSPDEYLVEKILPYLHSVTELKLLVRTPAERESLRHLRPEFCSQLVSLDMNTMQDPEILESNSPYNRVLFGTSSRLERLTLRSDAPSFLLTDIPWSQLHTFNILFRDTDDITIREDEESWREDHWAHLSCIPFHDMRCLTEMSLALPDELVPRILSYDFPWQNLTSFTLIWPWGTHDFSTVVKVLESCPSLKSLELDNDIAIPAAFDVANISTPSSLESLKLRGIPFTLARHLCAASGLHLRNLKIANVLRIPEIFSILKKCSYHPESTFYLLTFAEN